MENVSKFKTPLLFISTLLVVVLSSCEKAGKLERIDKGNNEKIEVFKYWYDDACVYVARFKDTPNVVSTTWKEQGKCQVTKGNVVIFENDSIQVVRKNNY